MDLVASATTLRNQIWASLPFRVRFAALLTRLASYKTEPFGKAIYAEFLKRRVKGMPDINGRPAEEYDTSSLHWADRLPHGYGALFGEKVYNSLVKSYSRPEFVEEVMQSFYERFLRGGSNNLVPGTSLSVAEQYVVTGLFRQALSMAGSMTWWDYHNPTKIPPRERSTPGELPVDLLHLPVDLKLLKGELSRIHPDALHYLELVMEGYDDKEIVGDPSKGIRSKLPHPFTKMHKPLTPSNWVMLYKPQIMEVLKDHMAD